MQQNFLKKLTERDFSADLPCWTPHGLIEVRDLESRLCKGDACLGILALTGHLSQPCKVQGARIWYFVFMFCWNAMLDFSLSRCLFLMPQKRRSLCVNIQPVSSGFIFITHLIHDAEPPSGSGTIGSCFRAHARTALSSPVVTIISSPSSAFPESNRVHHVTWFIS